MRRIVCVLFMVIMLFFSSFVVTGDSTKTKEITEITVTQELAEPVAQEVQIIKKDIKTIKQEEFNSKLIEIKDIENRKEWFLAYKDLIFKYVEWIEPPQTVFDTFTEEEVNLICRVVETETYDQNFDSKCNVASVVLNRFNSGDFGDTISEVVTNDNQFAYGRKNLTEDTILAVMYAFEIGDTANECLYFHSNKKTDTFCGAKYVFTDDAGHHFYRPEE